MRSFSRRVGKSLSIKKRAILKNDLPQYIFCPSSIDFENNIYTNLVLEIGFGNGEHLLYQAKNNLGNFYIGVEPYLNGVSGLLSEVIDCNIGNISVWPDDVDQILDKIPSSCLSQVFILFPDPWPKKRQQKKRLVNKTRMSIFLSKLKIGGSIYFASDALCYVLDVQNLAEEFFPNITFTVEDNASWDYVETKYHIKAKMSNNLPKFITITKRK